MAMLLLCKAHNMELYSLGIDKKFIGQNQLDSPALDL
jgi:hypothetical protein